MTVKSRSKTVTYVRKNTSGNNVVNNITTVRSHNGADLPLHRQVIKNYGNATTAFTAMESTFKCFIGQTSWEDLYMGKWYPKQETYQNLGFAQVLEPNIGDQPSLVNRAKADAISNAYSKIRQLQTPFEGSIFLGELKETVQFLKSPHKTSVELFKNLRASFMKKQSKARGLNPKSREYKQLLKSAAKEWLEFRFAVLPLISDMDQIVKLVSERTQRKQQETVRGYGRAETSSSSMVDGGGGAMIEITDRYIVENIIRAGVLFQHLEKYETLQGRVSDIFDDISTVPITLWELTKLSWLVDYFVNVGDIIQAGFTAQSNVSYVSNSLVLTRQQERVVRTPLTYMSGASARLISFTPSSFTSTFRKVQRDGTLGAIPPLVFTLPGSNVRYANIAALSVIKLL